MKQLIYDAGLVRRSSESGVHEVVITTAGIKRDRNQIVPTGGKLDAYLRNPVVLYGHWGSPIGRTLALSVADDGITARFEFAPPGVSQQADEVRRLWEVGLLNAASIGILPLKSEELPDKEDSWWPPLKITEWELVEWSIVPVPADADALRRALGWEQIREAANRVVKPSEEELALQVIRELRSTLCLM